MYGMRLFTNNNEKIYQLLKILEILKNLQRTCSRSFTVPRFKFYIHLRALKYIEKWPHSNRAFLNHTVLDRLLIQLLALLLILAERHRVYQQWRQVATQHLQTLTLHLLRSMYTLIG